MGLLDRSGKWPRRDEYGSPTSERQCEQDDRAAEWAQIDQLRKESSQKRRRTVAAIEDGTLTVPQWQAEIARLEREVAFLRKQWNEKMGAIVLLCEERGDHIRRLQRVAQQHEDDGNFEAGAVLRGLCEQYITQSEGE